LTVNVRPAIVAVPVRAVVAVLAATDIATVPFPEPLAPLVIVSQDAPLVAVQAQPARLVTDTLAAWPPASALVDVGVIEYVQAAAAWFTLKVCPAMLSVPVREVVAVFALAEKLTVPLPLPEAPAVIVSHDAPLVAVHAQPTAALTPTDPVDAAAPTDADDADRAGAQGADLANVFERALVVDPPGPIAVTRDS
jgi:hypothetical protein